MALSVVFFIASRLGKNEPFGVSHLKLMKEDGTTIEDGTHELYAFKVESKPSCCSLVAGYFIPPRVPYRFSGGGGGMNIHKP